MRFVGVGQGDAGGAVRLVADDQIEVGQAEPPAPSAMTSIDW